MNISIIGTGYVGLVTGNGSANLVQIEEVAQEIALFINNYQVPPSLRATEGSAAIPPSSSYLSHLRGEHQFKTQRRAGPPVYKQYKGEY